MTPANLRRCAELLRSGEASAEIVAGEIECAADVLDRIQATHRLIARTEAGECWHWQGDGYDYPDSLACSVVIDHGVLRRLLLDAAMPEALTRKASQHLPSATDADAIVAAAKLACGLLWMTAEWRQGKTEAAYQALLEAVGGSGSQGLRESIQAALDAGHEVDAPPGCYWPGE